MVGIIIAVPVELSPFAKKYINILEERKIPYEIIQWVRSEGKDSDSKIHTYYEFTKRYGKLSEKVLPFLHFRRFAKRLIKKQKYDKLIVLTTQTAVVLFDLLSGRKYKNRFFFDYRDTSYEYIGLYKRLIDKIIMNSYATSVSSYGFKKYLTDKKELIVSHNFQDRYYEKRCLCCTEYDGKSPIVMGYVGYLREYEYLTKLVDVFGADKRFAFHIHGSGDCEEQLRSYAEKYENVKIFGAYKEDDKMSVVDTFDMICYNYPYSFVNYPAIANKFYDGMIRKKPMFANLDTFSGELVEKSGLGISLKENETDITDKIYEYFLNFDRKEFEKNCEEFLNKVMDEEKVYIDKINEFLNDREIQH